VYSRLLSISVAKRSHARLNKHTSEGSAVASNVPSARPLSEQTTEESEDDPVSQRSQGSLDDHEGGLPFVRYLFDWLLSTFVESE